MICIEFKKILKVVNQALIPMILVVVLPTTILGWVVSKELDILNLLVGILIIASIDMGGNALNNIADWEIDEINKKRILLHRTLSKKQLFLIFLLLFLLPVPFLIVGNIWLKLCILLGYLTAINYSYGLKLKDKVIGNYFNIAIFYGPFAFLYGYFASTSNLQLLIENWWMVLFVFLMDMGFAVTKDYEDVYGDKMLGKKTLPSVFGKEISLLYQFLIINLTFSLVMALIALKKIPFKFILLGIPYLIAFYVIRKVYFTDNAEEYHKAHNLIRLNALASRFMVALIYLLF